MTDNVLQASSSNLEILVNERSCQRLVFVIHSTPDQIEKLQLKAREVLPQPSQNSPNCIETFDNRRDRIYTFNTYASKIGEIPIWGPTIQCQNRLALSKKELCFSKVSNCKRISNLLILDVFQGFEDDFYTVLACPFHLNNIAVKFCQI